MKSSEMRYTSTYNIYSGNPYRAMWPLDATSMFCFREKSIGLTLIQQNEKSTQTYFLFTMRNRELKNIKEGEYLYRL